MKRRAWLFPTLWLALAAWPAFAQTDSPSEDKGTDPVEERLRKATVFVRMTLTKMNASGHGSGVILNRTGLVLTNNHVVDPSHQKPAAYRWEITKQGGKVEHSGVLDKEGPEQQEYKAVVVHQNEACDVAIIQLLDDDGKPVQTPNYLTFVPNGVLRTGQKIKTMGFPGDKDNKSPATLTLGLITQFIRAPSGFVSMIQTDATVVPGNSGGPVIEASGQLIGIVSRFEAGEGSKNKCGVVPGNLIKQFILSGFQQGRMPEKLDILPFLELFLDENDVYRLPGKDRVANAAVIHREDGSVRQCTIGVDKIVLPTPLGKLEVPTAGLAYILMQEGTGYAIFDGGDQLAFPASGVTLTVKIDNKPEQIKLADVAVVAFPLPAKPIALMPGMGTVLQAGDGCRIGLSEIKGDLTVGTTRCPLANVTLIQTDEDGKRTVSTTKGERIRGQVGDQLVTARVLWSTKPIQIRLAGIEQATFRPIAWPYVHARGRRLIDRMENLDGDLKTIAELLDGPDWQKAKPLLEAKSKSPGTGEAGRQFRLLKAIATLRGGDIAAAKDAFSKFPKTELIAQSYSRVLERYPDGTFQGEKLSNPDVLWRACNSEARRILASVAKDLNEAAKHAQDQPKPDYDSKMCVTLQKLEREVDIANQLDIGAAQAALVSVLENQYYYQIKRFEKLKEDYEEAGNTYSNSQTRGSAQANKRKLMAVDAQYKLWRKEIERIVDRYKVEGNGFRLETPEFKSQTPEN